MPQDILEFIKAVTAYKANRKAIDDSMTVAEFINMMGNLMDEQNEPSNTEPTPKTRCCKSRPQFDQQPGSYKVLSMNGTVTAIEIFSTDLVQVTKDRIHIVWPHTDIEFTTVPSDDCSYISKEVFDELANFVLQ